MPDPLPTGSDLCAQLTGACPPVTAEFICCGFTEWPVRLHVTRIGATGTCTCLPASFDLVYHPDSGDPGGLDGFGDGWVSDRIANGCSGLGAYLRFSPGCNFGAIVFILLPVGFAVFSSSSFGSCSPETVSLDPISITVIFELHTSTGAGECEGTVTYQITA